MRRERARGFTLLEAVVALAILAAAGMALFAAMTQSVQMVGRAAPSRAAAPARRTPVAYVGAGDQAADPPGPQPPGGYALGWNGAT
ncbi:MAG: prepilin-type N-terminal cleavage/methylation domain-containing protein, partial [Rhizobium sp.]|nr:prepilin-type N-terminal cleavage/methylation domain-containing protein [Rhizobium sp.]